MYISQECNLATVLITTTLTFWLLHMPRYVLYSKLKLNHKRALTRSSVAMPFLDAAEAERFRVLTSLYEALNVQNQMTCEKKGMDYLPLWFLYSIVVMNILLVLNASSNFLIYLFAGNSFRDQVQTCFHRVRKNDILFFPQFKRIFTLSRSGSNEVFCLGSLPLPGKNLFSRWRHQPQPATQAPRGL